GAAAGGRGRRGGGSPAVRRNAGARNPKFSTVRRIAIAACAPRSDAHAATFPRSEPSLGAADMNSTSNPKPAAAMQLKLGSLTVNGPMAPILGLLVLAGVVALSVWSRPSIGMLLAGAFWLGFGVYWGAPAGHQGTAEA